MSTWNATGSRQDPVVLDGDSSSNDEAVDSTPRMTAGAKRGPPSKESISLTLKRPKKDRDDDVSSPPTPTSSIKPATPLLDPFLAVGQQCMDTTQTMAFVIYMAIEEAPPLASNFQMGLEKCAQNCSKSIHQKLRCTRPIT